MPNKIIACRVLFAVSLIVFTSAAAAPFGTTFRYQGRLVDGGTAANGLYDLTFSLFDAPTGGAQIADPAEIAPVPVSNGVFSVSLDLGAAAFNGNGRWLQIAVTRYGTDQPVVLLSPRQPVTPTPYALYSRTAEGLGANPTFSSTVTFASPVSEPFRVNSSNRVANLNADFLDGLDSTGFWKLGGNAGTQTSTDFIGTVDNQPLDFRANGARAFRLEEGAQGAPNVVGGCESNRVGMGIFGSTIAGGGSTLIFGPNIILANIATIGGGIANSILEDAGGSVIGGGFGHTIHYSSGGSTISGGNGNIIDENTLGGTIGGGSGNQISMFCYHATVAGGNGNTIEYNNNFSFIGAGWDNRIASNAGTALICGGSDNRIDVGGTSAAILGGNYNTNGGRSSMIGGGDCNVVRGANSVIPGGAFNTVEGNYAFAGGRFAHARHDGAFVWNDSSFTGASSDSANQFVVRATGGFKFYTSTNTPGTGVQLPAGSGAWASLSDRAAKTNVVAVDGRQILDCLETVPIATWNYKSQDPSIRHIGPMAQDFAAAFGVGEDARHITTIDADGVALAAIQGLNSRLKEKEAEVDSLKHRLTELEMLVKEMARH